MQTSPVTSEQFSQSVLAVPPLARDRDLKLCRSNNEKIIRHLEAGGVSMLLYGGNANLYHARVSEYATLLQMLSEIAADDTLMIPSVGPAYGTMMDQADVLKGTEFPTVMVLPTKVVMTEPGLMTGFRHLVETINRPAVLYIKEEGYISPEGAAELMADGLVSFIKYAIVRDDPAQDDYLERLVDKVDPRRICSGIGEQPALIHITKFRCSGYTSGCVCVNPGLSQKMLAAIVSRDYDAAEKIRKQFLPLEDLRNSIHPIRVLHEAIALSDIAGTGPHLPLLSGVPDSAHPRIKTAADALLAIN
ncbi:MAG: dihydrodipicolinate synthase family protein [Fuerstiella sp.]|nr:dihydrodipicolinate synthase family protein [Fuerstiella sp.]MCP4511303.1 dihydrodipicolinate synthase family protein [Fuerstiella sp.]MDG2130368.1 dihydrodipicolinate synthase family protein [Fuerstiella sp.]